MTSITHAIARLSTTLAALALLTAAAHAAPQPTGSQGPKPSQPATSTSTQDAIAFDFYDGVLTIFGTSGADDITISGSVTEGLSITIGSLPGALVLDAGAVTEVEVEAGTGDDTVTNLSDAFMMATGGAGVDSLSGAAGDVCIDENVTGQCSLADATDDADYGWTVEKGAE